MTDSQQGGKNQVRLPKGLKRAEIVPKSKDHYVREFDYDHAIDADFDAHRAEYTEIIMYGVPVKVKVEKDEGLEFELCDPKLK